MTQTLNTHEVLELARFAQAAYNTGHNEIGHFISTTAAFRTVPKARFDAAMASYRAWLCFNEYTI